MNQKLFTLDAESVVFHPLQSVAPQTSTCSCRKPLVQKLDTFHNEYLSAFYNQSRWLQNFRLLYFFLFFFFLQGLKNILLSTLKTLHSLSPQKEILTKKKSLFSIRSRRPVGWVQVHLPSTRCFSQRGVRLEGGQSPNESCQESVV